MHLWRHSWLKFCSAKLFPEETWMKRGLPNAKTGAQVTTCARRVDCMSCNHCIDHKPLSWSPSWTKPSTSEGLICYPWHWIRTTTDVRRCGCRSITWSCSGGSFWRGGCGLAADPIPAVLSSCQLQGHKLKSKGPEPSQRWWTSIASHESWTRLWFSSISQRCRTIRTSDELWGRWTS